MQLSAGKPWAPAMALPDGSAPLNTKALLLLIDASSFNVVADLRPVGCEVGPPWIGLAAARPNDFSIVLGSREFGGQIGTLNSSSSYSWFIFVEWLDALSLRGHCHYIVP